MLKNFYHCTVSSLAKQIVEGDGIVPVLNGSMGITSWYVVLGNVPNAILHVMKKYKVGIDDVSVLAVYEDEQLFMSFLEGIVYTQCRFQPMFCGDARRFMSDVYPLHELVWRHGRLTWAQNKEKAIDVNRNVAYSAVLQYAPSIVSDSQMVDVMWYDGDRPESALSELRSKRGQQDLVARSEYLRAKYGEKDSKQKSVK